MRIISNGLLFQLGWFIAVLAAARGQALLATLAPLGVVSVHLLQVPDRAAALKLIAAAALMGFIGETILVAIGFSQFAAPLPLATVAPAWVVALWMAFATLPNLALRWFREHLALVAVLGAVFGPLTYHGGAQLGAGRVGEPFWLIMGAVGLMWAIAAPLLLWLAKRWEAEDALPSRAT